MGLCTNRYATVVAAPGKITGRAPAEATGKAAAQASAQHLQECAAGAAAATGAAGVATLHIRKRIILNAADHNLGASATAYSHVCHFSPKAGFTRQNKPAQQAARQLAEQ